MRTTGYRKIFRPMTSRPPMVSSTAKIPNMSSLPGMATAAYKTYTQARRNSTYGPYIRKAEAYVGSRVRSAARNLVRRSVLLPKMRFSTHNASPGEISYSSHKRGKYHPPYFKAAIRTSQKYIFDRSSSAHTTFAIGSQGVNDLCVLRASDLKLVATKAYAAFGGAPGLSSDNYTVWFGTVKTTVRFANPGISSVSVDLYNYECRRDLNDVTVNGPTSLAQTWTQGAAWESTGVGYATTRLGAGPLDVNLSGQFWKILKKTTIQLPPGSEHIHVFTQHVNRKYNTIMDINVVDGAEIDAAHTGYTHGLLVVPSGAVVYDDLVVSAVDTANGALNYVYNTVFEVYNNSGSQPAVEYSDETSVVTVPKTIVVQNPTEVTP